MVGFCLLVGAVQALLWTALNCLVKMAATEAVLKREGRLRRAQALFYDDTADNFKGSGPRGTYPHIICQQLHAPLTIAMMEQALGLFESRKDDPLPFFFFDFDGTLTMADGLLQLEGGSLERLFGKIERRRALQQLLAPLLESQQVYILTANPVIKRVEEALNALVNSNARPGGDPRAKGGPKPPPKQTALQQGNAGGRRFAMQDTVRFVPKGTKLATIDAIIKERGFALVGANAK